MLHKLRPDILPSDDEELCEINKLVTQFNFKERFPQRSNLAKVAPGDNQLRPAPTNGYIPLRNKANLEKVHPMINGDTVMEPTQKNGNDSNHASFNDNEGSENEWQEGMFDAEKPYEILPNPQPLRPTMATVEESNNEDHGVN